MRRTFLFKGTLVVIVIALVLSACHSSYGYMDSFERFVERVEKNGSSYSNEEWEKKDEQFLEYLDKYSEVKDKLTSEDKTKVVKLAIRYGKARVVMPGIDVWEKVQDLLDLIKDFVDGIKTDMSLGDWFDLFQGFLDEIGDDIINDSNSNE